MKNTHHGEESLMQTTQALSEFAEMLVSELMDVPAALERMKEHAVPAFVVVDSAGRAIGVVDRRSLRHAVMTDGVRALGALAADNPLRVREGTPDDALRVLLGRAPLLPLVDESGRVSSVVVRAEPHVGVDPDISSVCVLGLGYVGLTLAAVLADVGFDVMGIDRDETLIRNLQCQHPHVHEKGLPEVLLKLSAGPEPRLRYRPNLAAPCAEVYIISVGTPIRRPSLEPDLDHACAAAREVGRVLMAGDLVILRSTVPVGTTREVVLPLLQELSGLTAGRDFSLAFCPERTVEGKALRELRELPQIIGGFDRRSAELATRLFSQNTSTILDVGSIESAEMIKIFDNTYRDVMFAYANQMALLCEQLGLDTVHLIRSANTGYNRNNIPVPSPGVGGACLSKDPYILASVCRRVGIDPTLFLLGRQINEYMPGHAFRRAEARLRQAGSSMADATVLVLGFTFKGKPETSDLRDSPTVDLLRHLRAAGATIRGYDPVVPGEELAALGVEPCALEDGFDGVDAVIIMLNHQAFEDMDLISLLRRARRPVVVVDGWHLFEPERMASVPGLIYECIGR